jgi:hypothetical protein
MIFNRALPFIAALFFGLVLAQSETPAVQSKSDPIKVFGQANGKLRFALGRNSRTLTVGDELAGCSSKMFDGGDPKTPPYTVVLEPRVIDQVQRKGFWYVTLQINLIGGCNINGLCGAGGASNVLWVKFDPALNILTHKTVIISDCRSNLELTRFTGRGGTDGIETELEMRNGKLELVFEDLDYSANTKLVTTLRYDRHQPHKGLVVSSKRLALK